MTEAFTFYLSVVTQEPPGRYSTSLSMWITITVCVKRDVPLDPKVAAQPSPSLRRPRQAPSEQALWALQLDKRTYGVDSSILSKQVQFANTDGIRNSLFKPFISHDKVSFVAACFAPRVLHFVSYRLAVRIEMYSYIILILALHYYSSSVIPEMVMACVIEDSFTWRRSALVRPRVMEKALW